jgi:hypothetical protein
MEEAQVHVIIDTRIEKVDFIARNSYNPTWKSQNYGSNFSKQYPNPAESSNNNNM